MKSTKSMKSIGLIKPNQVNKEVMLIKFLKFSFLFSSIYIKGTSIKNVKHYFLFYSVECLLRERIQNLLLF